MNGSAGEAGRPAICTVGLALQLEHLAVRMRGAAFAGVWHACAWDCEGQSRLRLLSKPALKQPCKQ